MCSLMVACLRAAFKSILDFSCIYRLVLETKHPLRVTRNCKKKDRTTKRKACMKKKCPNITSIKVTKKVINASECHQQTLFKIKFNKSTMPQQTIVLTSFEICQ